jgi:hypothetical protein
MVPGFISCIPGIISVKETGISRYPIKDVEGSRIYVALGAQMFFKNISPKRCVIR